MDGGAKVVTAEASPMTASEETKATTAGTRDGLTRGGGGPRTGGARLGTRRAASRTPEAHVAVMRTTNGIGTFDRAVVLGKPSAEP